MKVQWSFLETIRSVILQETEEAGELIHFPLNSIQEIFGNVKRGS